MSKLECKFCAGIAPDVTGEKVSGSGTWKGYTFQALGHRYDAGETPPEPPEIRGRKLAEFKLLRGTWPLLVSGCHIKHESGVESVTHWWPSHGIKTEVWNLGAPASGDLLKKLINLFTPETRGAQGKLSEAEVAKTVRKLGGGATQRAVARKLGVTPRALQLWTTRHRLGGWELMRKTYTAGDSVAK
jgi:hypothetical protein